MAVEPGQVVLLYVGDGGELAMSAAVFSVVGNSAGGGIIHRSTGAFTGVLPGMIAHIEGFDLNTPEFHGVVAAVDADDLTLQNIVDADGNPLVLQDEALGAAVIVSVETFHRIKGQDDTQIATAATSFDTSTKDTGKWGTSLADTVKQTVSVNGKVNWPDDRGVKRMLRELDVDGEAWFKMVMNEKGDYWIGQYVVTQCNLGGAKGGPTTYSVNLENKLRPQFIEV